MNRYLLFAVFSVFIFSGKSIAQTNEVWSDQGIQGTVIEDIGFDTVILHGLMQPQTIDAKEAVNDQPIKYRIHALLTPRGKLINAQMTIWQFKPIEEIEEEIEETPSRIKKWPRVRYYNLILRDSRGPFNVRGRGPMYGLETDFEKTSPTLERPRDDIEATFSMKFSVDVDAGSIEELDVEFKDITLRSKGRIFEFPLTIWDVKGGHMTATSVQ